jgi:P2-related tail formation protein
VHTHKGTRGGVEDALLALGVKVEIKEWWQQEPQGEHGTMEVTLWINTTLIPDASMIIGPTTVRDLIEQLNNSKRASIHYTLKLAVAASPVTAGLGMSAQMMALQRTQAAQNSTQTHAQPAQMGMGLSGQLITLQKIDATPSHIESNPLPTVWCLGMSTQLTTLHRLELTL